MKIFLSIPLAALLAFSATAQVNVPFEHIRNASAEPGNWLTYGGDYYAQRYSTLSEITPKNISRLKPAWIYQSHEAGRWEVTPLVVNGIIYVSENPHVVTAIDGRTGRPLWNYTRNMPDDVTACCGPVNRGLAILGNSLYLCTFDCHLVCLDANTGHERWDVVVTDYKAGYAMTVAPLAVKDKIIVGVSGGEFGIRGFLDAYDAKNGAHAWRFWTIPGAGEPGNETWGKGDAWKHGGVATWVTGSYDPDLNLVYWGTGNPGPDYNGDNRPGDNLYACSVVAIDPDTGKLRWYFQYTPHDVHDWDSDEVPVLLDAKIDGKPRKLLVQANRNAFYYVLDRATGEFITGKPFAKETWASGLDSKGRPILVPGKEPSREGTLVYPGLEGASNWPPPAYSPRTGLFYVHAQDDFGQIFYKQDADFAPRRDFEGGGGRNLLGAEPYGAVKALDATTGDVKWEFKEVTWSFSGLLATSTGLLFGGTHDGYVYALDAATGKDLWRFQTGAEILGGPVTFLVDGKQYVAITAGSSLLAFSL